MNNFFYNESDFSLFRKALKQTESEPVIINILSTDSSLKEANKHEEAPVVRKNLSSKFKPNPFNKFFGPRKQRTTPVDMGNFSSWKNKNYREAEKKIGLAETTETKFSLTDYLNKNASEKKFNDVDQLKSDNQKPINQLSTNDPMYKKYSLDSYLNKLEQQSKVNTEFEENSDILEPLVEMQNVVPTSSQDEVFGNDNAVNVEDFSFDEVFAGEKFRFETEELEKVRARLDKLEREASNTKLKPTEKVISTNELTDIAKDGEEDDFDLANLGIDEDELLDDIEKVNDKLGAEDVQEKDDTPKVQGKRFVEINRNPESAKKRGAVIEKDIVSAAEESAEEKKDDNKPESKDAETEAKTDNAENLTETPKVEDEKADFVTGKTISREDILTKEDFRTITDEFMSKFTELYGKSGGEKTALGSQAEKAKAGGVEINKNEDNLPLVDDEIDAYAPEQMQQFGTYAPIDSQYLQMQQNELQAKIIEMLDRNNKSDFEAEERLRMAKLETQRVAEEYESRLKELESSFRKRDEELQKQAYLDKLKSDIKLKKAETNFKKKEEEYREMANESSEKAKFGLMLKNELENNLNISNLEMDKKLLEVASKHSKKVEIEEPEVENIDDIEEEIVEDEVEEVAKPKKSAARRPASRRRTSSRSTSRTTRTRTRSPRRKMDSDIIGGIDFE